MDVCELSGKSSIKIVLAHIERYYRLQKKAVWERLRESGVLMQVNAKYFTSFASRRRAITMLKEGDIHFLGSDCHNLTSRAPQIGKAFEIIQNKLGEEYITQMNSYGRSMLTSTKN